MFEHAEDNVDYSKADSRLPSTEPSNLQPQRDGSDILVQVFSVETIEQE